nr:NAD(P)H-dependent oxidoreductase [Methylonatrum kenyense]
MILVVAGSTRGASFNRKLASCAADIALQQQARVELIELADYPMPLYDGDLETREGVPESARALKARFLACDGFFIASPEYNGFFPPLLKNTLDWISRRESDEEPPLVAYAGKVAALGGASPGRLGGMRALAHLRTLLAGIGVHVVPGQVTVGQAGDAFDANGQLQDQATAEALRDLMARCIRTARLLAAD